MEDYHLIMLNTSGLGQDIILAGDSMPACKRGGILGKICESATSKAGDVLEDLVEDDVAGNLAETLGIQQWYSLHVMTLCEGTFDSTGAYNTTNCTEPLKSRITPATHLGLADDLRSQLDKIPRLFQALSAIYILAIVSSGLSLLLAAGRRFIRPSFVLPASLTSAITAVLGVLGLLIANVLVTGSVRPAADRVNEFGEEIGLLASRGRKFLVITWCVFAAMLIATALWVALKCCNCYDFEYLRTWTTAGYPC
ncbi:hypothetical protein VUR80DRAFT_6780 [Thermomyces stellatus]